MQLAYFRELRKPVADDRRVRQQRIDPSNRPAMCRVCGAGFSAYLKETYQRRAIIVDMNTALGEFAWLAVTIAGCVTGATTRAVLLPACRSDHQIMGRLPLTGRHGSSR
jgi:hypothetical protein